MLLSYILNYRIFNSWVIPPPKEGIPPQRRAVSGIIYTKRKKGEGGLPPLSGWIEGRFRDCRDHFFAVELRFLWIGGISVKQKQRDRSIKILVFCQHIPNRSRGFEKGIWLVVCRENRVLLWNRAEQDPGEWSWEWSRCGLLGRDAIIWYFNKNYVWGGIL